MNRDDRYEIRGIYDQRERVVKRFDRSTSSGRSVTKQSFRDDCEINTIVGRWLKTGINPHQNPNKPRWGEITDGMEYQDLLFRLREADASFERLPSALRARFENDPSQMLDFLADANNQAEAESLGLVVPSGGIPPDPDEATKPPAQNPPSPPQKPAQIQENSPTAGGGENTPNQ